jgi:hypothetical protein
LGAFVVVYFLRCGYFQNYSDIKILPSGLEERVVIHDDVQDLPVFIQGSPKGLGLSEENKLLTDCAHREFMQHICLLLGMTGMLFSIILYCL